MKISDVIRNISDMVDTTPTERSSGDNTSKFTAFTGDLTLVELPDGEDEKRREPGTMPSGNDAMPEDLYLPPLQLKSELLKKAVDVENVFDDGTPAVRYDEEYGEEGWHGDESDHDYIGAPQTAERVDGTETEQPDPNETSYDPYSKSERPKSKKSSSDSDDSDDSENDGEDEDDERERADESLQRILQLANLREGDQHWYKDEYDADSASRKDDMGSIVKRMKAAVAEEWDDDFDDFDSDVGRADRELSRMGKAPIKAAVIDIDSDDEDGFDFDDAFEMRLDELSKKTLGSYAKKATRSAGNDSALWGYLHGRGADSSEKSPFTNKIVKREKGIDRAVDRLTREEDECLNELSKDTLGSYAKKAASDALGKAVVGGSDLGRGDREAGSRRVQKASNRTQGIHRAVDRLTREETECLDEAKKELSRVKELAGLNPVVLDELNDDNAV